MDYQFWVPLGATIVIGCITAYQTYLTRVQLNLMRSRKKPKSDVTGSKAYFQIIACFVLMLGAWVPYVMGRYLSSEVPPGYMLKWGLAGPDGATYTADTVPDMRVITNGKFFAEYKGKYRLAVVAFHDFGTTPTDQIRNICKSAAYEIDDGEIYIGIPICDAFRAELRLGVKGTNYKLLLVPVSVTMDQFDTIKQAKALGVLVEVTNGGGP